MRERGWFGRASGVVRRHRPDYMVVLYTGILMLLGLVIIYAIGPQRANVLNNAYGSEYSDSYFFVKQMISLALALAAFGLAATVPYKLFLKHSRGVMIIGLIACIVLAIQARALSC